MENPRRKTTDIKMCKTKSVTAGRDVVRRENKTHIEEQTRHVYAKSSGFHILEVNAAGAGGGGGYTGIGIVGEIFIVLTIGFIILWCIRKYMAHRVRHNAYKVYYRAQVADLPYSLPVPTNGDAQPAVTWRNADFEALAREVKELKRARRDFERRLVPVTNSAPATLAQVPAQAQGSGNTVTTTAEVHGNPDGVGRNVRNVYADIQTAT